MGERTPVRQWVFAAAGLLMIVAAAVFVFRDRSRPAPAPPAAPTGQTAVSIEPLGRALKLRWDPNSPGVRAATAGALVISDGKRESRMELTGRDLRAGVASYWPESRDVAFRLELDGTPVGSARTLANVEERRPSPFASTEAPRRRAAPIKRVQAQPVSYEAEEPKRRSKFRRAVSKIPLFGRLARDRDVERSHGRK